MARRKKRGTKRKSSKRRMSGFGGGNGKGLTKFIGPVLGLAGGLVLGSVVANQAAKMDFLKDKPIVANLGQAGLGMFVAPMFKGGLGTYAALGFAAGGALNGLKQVIPGLGAITEGDINDIMSGITVGNLTVGALQDGRGDIANDRDGEEY